MTRFPFRAGALALCALAIAACGSSSSSGNGEAAKSANQILSDAVSAAQGASSVRVSGSITDNGQPVSVDLKLVNGKGGSGSMTIQGAPVQIVDVNNTLYMNGSDAFWNKVGVRERGRRAVARQVAQSPGHRQFLLPGEPHERPRPVQPAAHQPWDADQGSDQVGQRAIGDRHHR